MKDKYSKIKDWFSVNRVDIIAMLVLVAIITCIICDTCASDNRRCAVC